MRLYLDSSAIVKLVQQEAESDALRRFLRRHRDDARVTSALARAEVVRAVFPGGPAAVSHARRQLARLHQVAVDFDVLDRAATVAPNGPLRTLDAIHLVSAQIVGAELRAVLTYDQRLGTALVAAGLPVEMPS